MKHRGRRVRADDLPAPRSAANGPMIPSRQSLGLAGRSGTRNGGLKASVAAAASPPSHPSPVPNAPNSEPARSQPATVGASHSGVQSYPAVPWEERLGPAGIAIGALVVCALAWFVTWKMF